MATPANANGLLVFWDEANKEMEPHIKDKKSEYRGLDYKPNTWHSICTTWDSTSGLVQLSIDGKYLIKKFSVSGSNIRGTTVIILGQVSPGNRVFQRAVVFQILPKISEGIWKHRISKGFSLTVCRSRIPTAGAST